MIAARRGLRRRRPSPPGPFSRLISRQSVRSTALPSNGPIGEVPHYDGAHNLDPGGNQVKLTDYWRILRTHWVAIVVITLVGGLAAYGWTQIQPKVYSANASGLLSTGVSSDLSSALAGENYAKSRIKAYMDVAKSRRVAEYAISTLDLDITPDVLITKVSVLNPLDTPVLKVTATADSPEQARDLAEAWVEGISEQVTALENADAPQGTNDRSIVAFTSLDSAVLPTEQSSPNTRLVVALGLLLGFALGVVYAILRNMFDRRIRSSEQLERETGLPVIGRIPFNKQFTESERLITSQGGNDAINRVASEHDVAEAMRELRTNLKFMDVDDPPRTIVVTSSLPGEGKSTIVANLAVTIAASGEQVVVVDGDLRRPSVARIFGVLPGVGLTDVLIGRAELQDVLQPWGGSGRLLVLGAGSVPPNPSELLGSNAMHAVVQELAKHAIVLIDAPPLIPVTDAAILTARTDGSLIIAYVRRTTYDAVNHSLQNLERVRGRALGVILNGVPRGGGNNSRYGYQYRGYHGNDVETDTPAEPETHVDVEPRLSRVESGRRVALEPNEGQINGAHTPTS